MKKILLLVILLIASLSTFAQNFIWAKAMGGTNSEKGNSITLDAVGNVFTTGAFNGTVDFDPGAGIFNLTSSNNQFIFISKLDAAGNFVWAKKMGGDIGNSLATDAFGNVFIIGNFTSTADFDPGAGTFNLTSSSNRSVFISKLDAAGNFVWAKAIANTGSGYNLGRSIALDAAGNVYTTGYFEGTSDFDPGAGIFNLTSAGVISNGDIFISKLDAAGNFVWAKKMGSTDYDHGRSIAVDAAGNVFTTGSFSSTVDFDPGAGTFYLTSSGTPDIFISKLDAAGNFVWAKKMGGSISEGLSIALDIAGNIFTTGNFQNTADFDPGAGTFNLTGNPGVFISKLDAAGNFVWAKALSGTISDYSRSIVIDAAGNVFTTGSFYSTTDFDPGPGTFNLTSAGSYDIFISKLDAAGNFVWAETMGGTSDDKGNSIALDAYGNVFTTGSGGAADFDPGLGTFNLITAGFEDIFVLKLTGSVTAAGYIFNDLNANCTNEALENQVTGIVPITIQPGNIVVQTNNSSWYIDSLPAGSYTATVDTSGQWKATCSPSVTFTVVHPDSFVQVPPIGMRNTNPCTEPEISITAPFLRRCFSNQMVYLSASNFSTATQVLYNSYADIKLDSFLTINSSTKPYTSLGNNTYRFQLDSLYPSQSKDWEILTTVSCSAQLGRTLTLQANLYLLHLVF